MYVCGGGGGRLGMHVSLELGWLMLFSGLINKYYLSRLKLFHFSVPSKVK